MKCRENTNIEKRNLSSKGKMENKLRKGGLKISELRGENSGYYAKGFTEGEEFFSNGINQWKISREKSLQGSEIRSPCAPLISLSRVKLYPIEHQYTGTSRIFTLGINLIELK